mgnify:FL=1
MIKSNNWKCLILRRRLPNSTGVLPEFDHGRLAKMTIYEIISLVINLAILILEALSYLKNKKS